MIQDQSRPDHIAITNGKALREKADDSIIYTLRINNTTRGSRLEVSGKLTREQQQRIFEILGVE